MIARPDRIFSFLKRNEGTLNKYKIIFCGVLLLCVMPAEAQASGLIIVYSMYWIIGLIQLLPLFLLCSKRMEGRSLVASLAYLVLLGLLWKYVVLALPPDRALSFSEAEWFSRTLGRKWEYLRDTFGAEDGNIYYSIQTLYVPLLLPPLVAWGMYMVLRMNDEV